MSERAFPVGIWKEFLSELGLLGGSRQLIRSIAEFRIEGVEGLLPSAGVRAAMNDLHAHRRRPVIVPAELYWIGFKFKSCNMWPPRQVSDAPDARCALG